MKMTPEKFCWDCNITFSRKASRGKSPLANDPSLTPGSCLMLDIHNNPSRIGLTKATHFANYLQITDGLTCFTVLMGLKDMSSYSIFLALCNYAQWFRPNPTFNASRVIHVHSDFGSAFTSKDLEDDCAQYNIIIITAAPCHQEMNGICERTWSLLWNIAFSFLVHARLGLEFFDRAIEHA